MSLMSGSNVARLAAVLLTCLSLFGVLVADVRAGDIVEAVEVEAKQRSGTVGWPFQLAIQDAPDPNLTYTWSFDDGDEMTGPLVTKSFAEAGVYGVDIEARDGAGTLIGQNAIILTVFDGFGMDFAGNPFPENPGDVNGDGDRTLRDVQMIRQHLAGAVILTDNDERARADFDLDGDIDATDAELLALGILSPADFPSRLVPDAIQPGGLLTVFSPGLLEPTADIAVQFGNADPVTLPRIALGQVQAYVPLDVLSPGQFTTTGGETVVRLLDDGAVIDEYTLRIIDPDPVNAAAPLEDVETYFTNVAMLRSMLPDLLDDLRTNDLFLSLGYSTQDAEAISIALESLFANISDAEVSILQQLQMLPPDRQEAAIRVANAAGLQDALARVQALLDELGPDARGLTVDASDVEVLCRVGAAAEALTATADITGALCAGLTILAGICIAFPLDGPICDIAALLAAASACITYSGYVETAGFILEMAPQLGDELTLSVVTDSNADPPVHTVTVSALFTAPWCGELIGSAVPDVVARLRAKLALRILRSGPVWPIYRAARLISEQTAQQIWDQVNNVLSQLIGDFGFNDLVSGIANGVCAAIGLNGANVPVDANDLTINVSPNVGSWNVDGEGRIVYTCPDPTRGGGAEEVELFVTFSTCAGTLLESVNLPCEAVRTFTLTIGDNGSATDDIFEAIIDGDVVLSMSAPTTARSTTVELAPGTYTFQMRGLAAPDGIGTYYASFSNGVTVSSGPDCGGSCSFVSGTTLTAGTVFTWTLNVPSN